MEKKNIMIRKALFDNNLPVWYLEKLLGKSGSSITRMMRDELPKEEQKRIVSLIKTACRDSTN